MNKERISERFSEVAAESALGTWCSANAPGHVKRRATSGGVALRASDMLASRAYTQTVS